MDYREDSGGFIGSTGILGVRGRPACNHSGSSCGPGDSGEVSPLDMLSSAGSGEASTSVQCVSGRLESAKLRDAADD